MSGTRLYTAWASSKVDMYPNDTLTAPAHHSTTLHVSREVRRSPCERPARGSLRRASIKGHATHRWGGR